ncbi:hypothetical protein A4X03_0g7910 [Tilletia caries]|uniref:Reverse transcriptase domain-containing protein n=1 Tax=Tilletia caries TaxID=13290 RepID=A0A8T8SLL7_9BASI|nr:hypothetical protein A4X03_0g7910 [Tilletia caries]
MEPRPALPEPVAADHHLTLGSIGWSKRTPLDAVYFEAELRRHGLLSRYPSLCSDLADGFRIGIPTISSTTTFSNHGSARSHPHVLSAAIARELDAGRYQGPFSAAQLQLLLGPFQTSPLGLVPKGSDDWRVIQDFSWPRDGNSINSHLSSNDWPTTWGASRDVVHTLLSLPVSAQGAVRDVANAFRLVPLHPSQWPGIVVRGLDDRFYIDQFLGFGLAPATGVWGRVADALADILRAHGIGPILKWVDDFLFLSVPLQDLPLVNQLRRQAAESIVERRTRGGVAYFADGEGKEHVEDYHFPLQNLSALRPTELVTSLSTISAISDPLGIPWKSEKDVDFCSAPVYIGFTWYIAERCVALPDSKRLKYLAALADWGQQPRQNLRAAQKLFGRLQHASFVVQQGRKRLGYLRRFVASLSHLSPHQRHRPGKQVAKDMAWWTSALSRPDLRRSFAKDDVFDKRFVACDASTTHGIGVVVDGAELFIPVTIGTRPSWRHSRVSVISKRHTTLKWYPSWFPARQTLPMDPLEVVAPHLRNFVVQVSIPQYGRSLDDRTWGALQPILSSTFASTSTSRATSFAPASAPRPPLPPPPARPPTTPPASASAATRTTSKRRLPVAAGGYLEVPAALRLLDWVPPGSSLLSARDPQQRRRVLAAAWAESTLATYGTGLLRWLLWCEQHALPASARFPAHVGDVVDFIESVAGHFSGGSIRNWVSGLRAWHAIHGSALDTVHLRIVTALRGADRLTPESSKKPPPSTISPSPPLGDPAPCSTRQSA